MNKAVAIDGPAGAGKSTIARLVAQQIHFTYVDTGALYRAVAFAFMQYLNATSPSPTWSDLPAFTDELVERVLRMTHLELRLTQGENHIWLADCDVTEQLRTPELSALASKLSAFTQVREFLLSFQQDIANDHDVIMDGRDIGTVVLPHADVKIFLTATAEDRAKRRYEQLLEMGVVVDFEQLLAEINERDRNDTTRNIAPLKQAADAILVDTTGNTLEESIELLTNLITQRLSQG